MGQLKEIHVSEVQVGRKYDLHGDLDTFCTEFKVFGMHYISIPVNYEKPVLVHLGTPLRAHK